MKDLSNYNLKKKMGILDLEINSKVIKSEEFNDCDLNFFENDFINRFKDEPGLDYYGNINDINRERYRDRSDHERYHMDRDRHNDRHGDKTQGNHEKDEKDKRNDRLVTAKLKTESMLYLLTYF